MEFSFQVAPGVRIRASSGGVRAGVGPRVAQAHQGGGRTRASTEAGPVSLYTSLSGGSRGRSRSSGARPRSVAAARQALDLAVKQEATEDLRRALEDVLHLHRQDFPLSTAPQAPPPPPVDPAAVVAEHEARALAGIGRFQRAARQQARAAAAVSAQQHMAQLEARRQQQWHELQGQLDRWWDALLRNEPEIVLSVLGEAFDDNEAPAAAVGVDGSEVALVVLTPSVETIPERKPDRTPAGNPTLATLTTAERSSLHSAFVAAHVLLAVKEALAVAPALSGCRVVALQHSGHDADGQPRVEVLLAARFERDRLLGVRWSDTEALPAVADTATELVMDVHAGTGEMRPIGLDQEPAIGSLLDRLDVTDLVARP